MKRTTALIFALLLLLGLLLLERNRREEQQRLLAQQQAENSKLLIQGIEKSSVTQVSVSFESAIYSALYTKVARLGAEPETKWVTEKPAGAPVDGEVLDKLLDAILHLEFLNTVSSEEQKKLESATPTPTTLPPSASEDPTKVVDSLQLPEKRGDAFGFDPPQLSLSVEGPRRVSLLFGDVQQFSGRRYALREGERTLYLVSEKALEEIKALAKKLRRRQIFSFKADQVDGLAVVDSRVGTKIFSRNPDGDWIVTAGKLQFFADPTILQNVVSSLAALQAERFEDSYELGIDRFGLDPAYATLKVTYHHQEGASADSDSGAAVEQASIGVVGHIRREVTSTEKTDAVDEGRSPAAVGSLESDFYLRKIGAEWVYAVAGAAIRPLIQPYDYYRNRRPFSYLASSEVRKIRVV
ncbi:MAG: DUF4340 domain-containing protein, partial [Bdellovibrionales bacterium]|nr:DUF4340 domain-containing protein [Bdellovibrionales bacterium]